MFKAFSKGVISAVLAYSLFAGAGSAFVAAQAVAVEHTVDIASLNKYAPLQVVGLRDLSQSFPITPSDHRTVDGSFANAVVLRDSSADWIRNLSIIVENHSTKSISVIEAEMDVPSWQENPSRPHKFIVFHEGQLPEHARVDSSGESIAEQSSLTFLIKPGQSAAVPLRQAFAKLSRLAPSQPGSLASIDRVWVRIQRVFFSDGTLWQGNSYLKPDDSSPGHYTRIMQGEFNSQTN